MNSIIKAIKSLFDRFKYFFMKSKRLSIVFILIIVSLTLFGAFHLLSGENHDKKTVYVEKKSDYLFNINQPELTKVSAFIVFEENANQLRGNRDIFVKSTEAKDSEKVFVIRNVSQEAFDTYQKMVLIPYIEKSQKSLIKYVSNLENIKEPLQVSDDPSELIAEKNIAGFFGGFFDIFLRFGVVLIIIAFFIYMQRNTTTTAIKSIKPKDIKDSFDDLIGLDDVKEEVMQLEHMFKNKDLYKQHNIHSNFNVMMTGPAGVGKTKMARCLAKSLNIPMYYCSAASLQSGYVGGGSRALKQLVKSASKHGRAIIFLDEAESLLQSRTNGAQHWEKETINTLLSLLDGVQSNKGDIIWLVASNMDEYKISMDEAMLRRFQLKINFRLPNFEERSQIVKALLGKIDFKNLTPDIDVNHIAGVSSGMSPAIIETIVGRASLIAIQEGVQVSQDVLMRAFERVAVGLTDRETTANRDQERLVIARHEAGHFILKAHTALLESGGDLSALGKNLNVIKISTEAVSKLGALGFVLSKEKEDKLITRLDFEHEIMHLYGGMANEEIYYEAAGVTAGAQNDIEKVSHLLKVMVGQVGFYQPHKLNYSALGNTQALTNVQIKLVEQQSEKLYQEAKQVLIKHGSLTDMLVDRLMREYVLSIDQAIDIIIEYFSLNKNLLSYYLGEDKIIHLQKAN